jgi:hypothetical protein
VEKIMIKKCSIIFVSFFIIISNSFILNAYSKNLDQCNTTLDNFSYGELKVITDKEVYLIGENVNISIINIGEVGLGGEPRLRIMHVTQDNIIVHDAEINDLASMISVNQSFNYTWNQKDTDGIQVQEGLFYIQFFFVCCGGISVQNHTTFKIQNDPIYIENIVGGLGISIILKNIGMDSQYNVNYSIELSGFIIFGTNKKDQIEEIISQEKITIRHTIFGIGSSVITITLDEQNKTKECFIIGPFVLI